MTPGDWDALRTWVVAAVSRERDVATTDTQRQLWEHAQRIVLARIDDMCRNG